MEEGTIQHNKKQLFFAEFLACMFFTSAIFYSSLYHEGLTAVIGSSCGLFVALTSFGKYTGGHLNPSISTGYWWFVKRSSFREILPNYLTLVAAQFAGCTAAGFNLYIVAGEKSPILLPQNTNIWACFYNEVFFSCMFITVVYCIMSSKIKYTNDPMLGALGSSIAVTGSVLSGAKVSGACYNPAIGFALNFWASINHGDSEYLRYWALYFAAPTVGAIIAGFIVKTYMEHTLIFHAQNKKPLKKAYSQPLLPEKETNEEGDMEMQSMVTKASLQNGKIEAKI